MVEEEFNGRVRRVTFKRFVEGSLKDEEGFLPVQKNVDIFINGERLTGLSCLPSDLKSLAVGFLLTEGIISNASDIASLRIDESDEVIKVSADIPDVKIERVSGKLRLTSGCGKAVSVDDVESLLECGRPFNMAFQMKASKILEFMGAFLRSSKFHIHVGGVHSAALSFGDKLDYFSDDISRHNAVDRAIGQAFMDGRDLASTVLLTTGRLTFDVITKAARMRIPVAVSLLSTTYQAVELAKKFHIALCSRCRGKQMDVYTCDWRIVK